MTKPNARSFERHVRSELTSSIANRGGVGQTDLDKTINSLISASCQDDMKSCVDLARSQIQANSEDYVLVRIGSIEWLSGQELCLGAFRNWTCFPIDQQSG